jgi:hypothetical protein
MMRTPRPGKQRKVVKTGRFGHQVWAHTRSRRRFEPENREDDSDIKSRRKALSDTSPSRRFGHQSRKLRDLMDTSPGRRFGHQSRKLRDLIGHRSGQTFWTTSRRYAHLIGHRSGKKRFVRHGRDHLNPQRYSSSGVPKKSSLLGVPRSSRP